MCTHRWSSITTRHQDPPLRVPHNSSYPPSRESERRNESNRVAPGATMPVARFSCYISIIHVLFEVSGRIPFQKWGTTVRVLLKSCLLAFSGPCSLLPFLLILLLLSHCHSPRNCQFLPPSPLTLYLPPVSSWCCCFSHLSCLKYVSRKLVAGVLGVPPPPRLWNLRAPGAWFRDRFVVVGKGSVFVVWV